MVPPPTAPESVSCILYYSDVDDCLGPTAFKPMAEHFGDESSETSWRLATSGEEFGGEHPVSRSFTTTRTAQQRPDLYEVSPGAQRRP